MPPLLVLLPSPLLGSAVWGPVEQALSGAGWPTATVTVRGPISTGQDVLTATLAALLRDRELVVVAHSNAGAYLPVLVTSRLVPAAVFVDAVLPPSMGGPVPLAPPKFVQFLRDKADAGGLLPPWTAWWDDTDVAALFPDAGTRALVEREQPRLPLSYFQSTVDAPPNWDRRPMAYLAFGDTYAAERADAEHRGWPTVTLKGQHLHMLLDPEQVTLELTALLHRLGVPAPR